jgi:hypothetical protein
MTSHTATGEWKSFEVRMRRRRVDRLLLRAEVALEEGCPEAARACLTEARELAPELPAIDAIQRRLDAAGRFRLSAARFRRRALTVGLSACGLLGLAAFVAFPRAHETPARAITDTADLRGVAPAVVVPAVVVPAVSSARFRVQAEPAEMPFRSKADAPSSPARDRETPAEVRLDGGPPVIGALPAAALLAAAPLTLPAAPAAAPPPSADGVRHTLDRYAEAYSALDAAAAQRVWPAVNQAALARAFDALASQRVSLGECRIEVRDTTARARCSGSATWAPRIGDGSARTEAREWIFDLVRAGTDWQILSARAQNK